MTYSEQVRTLGDRAGLATVALYRQNLPEREFQHVGSDLLVTATRRSWTLGDVAGRAALEVGSGAILVASDLIYPPSPKVRLERALVTVLTSRSKEEVVIRLTRLALAEVASFAAQAMLERYRQDDRVNGWTRGVSAGACELCQHWERDGRVWPDSHPMPRHKGCTCKPIPVFREEIQPLHYERSQGGQGYAQYQRRLDRTAARRAERRAIARGRDN